MIKKCAVLGRHKVPESIDGYDCDELLLRHGDNCASCGDVYQIGAYDRQIR